MPHPNPLLKKLGLADTDRAVIIHADDIGMCQATLPAFERLWEFGTISSGAVMVPCPWFPAAAALCRANPAMDMGVHATLNAEWESMRWGPVSTRDPASGLLDRDGYFHQWNEGTYEHARPEAVSLELAAQVEQALAAGIDVTHIDSHMGTILYPSYVECYVMEAASRLLPSMLPRASAKGFDVMGITEEELRPFLPILEQLEAQGLPMLDGLFCMSLEAPGVEENIALAKHLLGGLPAGISHFILHPSVDTPELRAICADWQSRVSNYEAFMSRELKEFIQNSGIHLIGYRLLREAMRCA